MLRQLPPQLLAGLMLLLGAEGASRGAQLPAQGGAAFAIHEKGPRNAAVGLALEPESSRRRTWYRFRLSGKRTCTPTATRAPLLQEYRLRDITDWQTSQGCDRVYRKLTAIPDLRLSGAIPDGAPELDRDGWSARLSVAVDRSSGGPSADCR